MKKYFPNYLRVPVFFFIVFGLMEYFIDSGEQPAFVKFPMTILFLLVVLVVLIGIEMVISAIDNMTYHLLTEEQKKALDAEEDKPFTESEWYKNLMAKLTNARPVEDNDKLLLNHDYDGIRELDNNLPPWWLYLFYGCVIFSGVYLVYYEMMDGPSQEDELATELAEAKIAVEEYKKNAPDMMDEKTVTLTTDAGDLAKGKEIYATNCAACHRADGGGQIGPNLTDEHWILGGGIKEVFHTISNGGRDGKGMVAWKGNLKPREIQYVASYILSLKGSNPAEPKAPEGDIWVDKETPVVAQAK